MAFSVGMGDRSGLKSPRDDPPFAPLASPLRTMGSQMASSNDARGQLHRRFTTNNIPTLSTPLSPIGQQRRQAAEPAEFTTAVRSTSLYILSNTRLHMDRPSRTLLLVAAMRFWSRAGCYESIVVTMEMPASSWLCARIA